MLTPLFLSGNFVPELFAAKGDVAKNLYKLVGWGCSAVAGVHGWTAISVKDLELTQE